MRNIKYCKFAIMVLLTTFTTRSMVLAKWSIFDMGRASYSMNSIVIGDVRNDGITRIYSSCADTNIYEFSYTGTSWANIHIGQAWGVMNCLAIGKGRNDGINRLYAAAPNSQIYELTYASDGSLSRLIALGPTPALPNGMNGVTLGNGRNDAKIRVYGACDDCHVYEFSYSGSGDTWYTVDLGSGTLGMTKVTLAAGRNNGVISVYASNNDSHIYEFTYFGSSWTKTDMGSCGSSMRGISAGNARNDGTNRLYGANADGRVYEFEYSNSGSTWTVYCMDGSSLSNANSWMEGVVLDTGMNDGLMRVYGADHDTHLYEFTYTASTFTKFDMGPCGTSVNAIASGYGRNDGLTRIYAANANNHIYEYTYSTSTLISQNQSNNAIVNAVVYPSFANLSKGDKINFANFTPGAHIVIITLAGHVIKTLQADVNGLIPSWDGTIDNGGKAASGTYIVHSSDNTGGYKIFKIMLIK